MKLEQQVCSLDLAKKLKELGVKQESLFWWVSGRMSYGYEGEWSVKQTEIDEYFLFDHEVGIEWQPTYHFEVDAGDTGETEDDFLKWERRKKAAEKTMLSKVCSAFTVAELGKMLPNAIENDGLIYYQQIANGNGLKYPCYTNYRGGAPFILGGYPLQTASTEADARAKMLIYLIENKLVTLV